MLTVYAFIGYLLLAILIPLSVALVPVWRSARAQRVRCPASGKPAVVALDPWYAVKQHTFGNDEQRARGCSEWPCGDCRQECLGQIHAA